MLSYVSQAHYAHSIILCLIEGRLTFNIRLSFHTQTWNIEQPVMANERRRRKAVLNWKKSLPKMQTAV